MLKLQNCNLESEMHDFIYFFVINVYCGEVLKLIAFLQFYRFIIGTTMRVIKNPNDR